MADEADMTADRQEREAAYLLRAAMKPAGPQPAGFCLFCKEPFADLTLRFCDAFCRDGYDKEQQRQPRNT